MADKNFLITTIMLVMTLVLITVPLVSAAGLTATWNSKGATGLNYSNLTGSFTFNCTATAKAVTNVTIYANSTAGVMNPLQSFVNTSANQAAWTGTVTITAADDGSNQNLSCYVRNSTANAYSNEEGAWHVRLDTTSPVCNITILHPSIDYAGGQRIEYYSSDALARRLTTIDVNGPEQQTTITLTGQNGPIELASNDTKYIGSWTVNMTVTDWSGNSCTDSATFKSSLNDGTGIIGTTPEARAPLDTNTILLLAVVIGLIWFFSSKKK